MQKNRNGFSRIEKIVLIMIFFLLVIISAYTLSRISSVTKMNMDMTNLVNLNSATSNYQYDTKLPREQLFSEIPDDQDKLEFLVRSEYLKYLLVPQKEGNSFHWDTITLSWQLISNVDAASMDVASVSPSNYDEWNKSETYLKDSLVYFNGALFYNIEKVTGIEPGTGRTWQKVTNEWYKHNIYDVGDTVFHQGIEYVASKNSINKVPSSMSKYWTKK